MFDELDTAEQETESDGKNDEPASYRWAHFPALLVFGLLILLLHRIACGWQIAIGGGYTVYVFWFALGLGLKNSDDLFGDSEVQLYVAKLLVPHALILALIILGVTEWFHLKPTLPDWATHEGRKGSLWDLLGWFTLGIAGVWQGFWMGGKIKRHFADHEDSA